MISAPSTTWLLVTAYPLAEMKKPEPCPMSTSSSFGFPSAPLEPPSWREGSVRYFSGDAAALLSSSFGASFDEHPILTQTDMTAQHTRATMSAKPYEQERDSVP